MSEQKAIPTPYRLVTPRLVIRCWEPKDAALEKAAIDISIEHLRPWMPWAHHEPTDLDAKIELMRRFRGNFDLGNDFVYGIFSRDESMALGGTGLHTRIGDRAREIGYWIRADAIHQGYATEAAGALTRVGFELLRLQRMEIHCDVANVRSAAVPARLGYTHEATLRRRTPAGTEPHDLMVWTLFADEYPRTPSARMLVEAFDAFGRPLEF